MGFATVPQPSPHFHHPTAAVAFTELSNYIRYHKRRMSGRKYNHQLSTINISMTYGSFLRNMHSITALLRISESKEYSKVGAALRPARIFQGVGP